MPLLDSVPGPLAQASLAIRDLGLKSALALVPSWQVGVEQAPPVDLAKFAREGYRRNELVYACIREIATTAAEVQLCIRDARGAPLPDHPAQRLLNRPNPQQSAFELWESVLIDLQVFGNAFILKQTPPAPAGAPTGRGGSSSAPSSPRGAPAGAPREIEALWKLRPDRITILPGSRRLVDAYLHRVGERETRLDPQDVLHFRFADPLNDLWGLSPLEVASRQIDIDTEASKFIDAFFRNAAVPFGIIKLKRSLRGGEEEAKRIGRRWTDRFRGLLGRFQVGVLDADADFQRIALTQEEMALPDVRAQTEARICAAFRVPPILVGAKVGLDRSTFSNAAQARRTFWENTMLALYRRIESKLDAELLPNYERLGETLRARFDFTDVAALRDSRESVERSAIAGLRAGALTINDARIRLGLDPLPDGDTLHPTGAGPASFADHHRLLTPEAARSRNGGVS